MEKPGGSGAVSLLLRQWGTGDQSSLNEPIPLVGAELRQIATRYMRAERRGHTLQTTALIHEAYLRLVRQDPNLRVCQRYGAQEPLPDTHSIGVPAACGAGGLAAVGKRYQNKNTEGGRATGCFASVQSHSLMRKCSS